MWWDLPNACRGALTLCAGGVLALSIGLNEAAAESTLISDKDDYAPGEIAILTGTGFASGEPVDLSVAMTDLVTGTFIADAAWTVEAADSAGAFVTEYLIPNEAADTLLTVTAIGLWSGEVATTTFTDNHGKGLVFCAGLPDGVVATVAIAGVDPVGQNFSVTQSTSGSAVAGNCSPGIIVKCFSLVEYAYAGSVTHAATGRIYDLASSSPGSPVLAGNPFLGCHFGFFDLPIIVHAMYVLRPLPEVTNDPPGLSVSDVDFGQVPGTLLNGAFQGTFQLTPEDFGVQVADPDGDPVAVTLDQSEVVLIGPGGAQTTVTITATDDPSGRDASLEALSVSASATVSAQLVYGFDGFQSPLSATKTRRVKTGATVPVKFGLFDSAAVEICGDLGFGPPVIDVRYNQGAAPDGDPEISDAGLSNDDTLGFRYDGACGEDGHWIYNLQTDPDTYVAGATYKINVGLNDGTWHDVFISMK